MNVAAIIAAAWVASLVIAGGYGVSVGKDAEKAKQADIEQAIVDTREAAAKGAAEAISKIKVKNMTIRGEVQREIQTNTVYRDCLVPANGVRIINEALTGKRPVAVGGGQLPGTD